MTRTRAVAAFGAVALAALAARSDPAPCLVSASAPGRAFVGQQIVLRIRILRRPDVSSATWISGPAFPGFRADPLPGLAGETRVHEQGAAYLVFEERHALFAVRAGPLELPAARLQCSLHALAGQPPRAVVAALPAVRIEAVAPPPEGRPDGWSGLVGEVRLEVRAEPRALELGGSLHAEVLVEGDADLRDLPPPFDGAREVAGAELFASRPRLLVDPGERLRLRRSFALELVPRAAGPFVLPSVRIPFFDPRTHRYGVAASAPVEVRVNPRSGG